MKNAFIFLVLLPEAQPFLTSGGVGCSVAREAGIHRTSCWLGPDEHSARQDTDRLLLDSGYDTEKLESFFRARPERSMARYSQIGLEVVGVLASLAAETTRSVLFPSLTADIEGNGAVAVHIRRAVTRLGPLFVKVGQALASRPDIVGTAIAAELQLLHDAMPFFPNEVARDFIREELGAYPEDLFDSIETNPVAAASLGQVYKGVANGRPVAVKVQRPDLLEAVGLDAYLLRSLAGTLTDASRLAVWGGRLEVKSDLVAAIDEYASRIFEELDYRIEARNMIRFKELYGDMPGIFVPSVLGSLSGRRVITSEWVEGDKLVDGRARVSATDMPLLRAGIDCTLTQLLSEGFLHADPHGGNLLKTPDSKLAYLDFGLVSEIPQVVMDSLIISAVHLMNRDYGALALDFPGLMLMSETDLERDMGPFSVALEEALDPVMIAFRRQLGLDGGPPGALLGGGFEQVAFAEVVDKVFTLARSFTFSVPPYFISNVRALGELEGLAISADPRFNLMEVLYPYVCRRFLADPSPRLRKAMMDFVVQPDGAVKWDLLEVLARDAKLLEGVPGQSPT
ncbi:unnamed protein product, partial [Discosporangium mesarthrocarpum]